MKTKSQELVVVEETNEYKKKRMREVRQMVAKAVANNQRVDLMGFEGSDIARSQIALQDLLTKEREKHTRARGHIINMKDETFMLATFLSLTTEAVTTLTQQMIQDDHVIRAMEGDNQRLADGWQKTIEEKDALSRSMVSLIRENKW